MPSTLSLNALLEQKRKALAKLQADIAALERAQALLRGESPPAETSGEPVRSVRPVGAPPVRTLVVDILKQSQKPLMPHEILTQLAARGRRINRSTLTHVLRRLRQREQVRRVGVGQYAVGASAPANAARRVLAASPGPRPPAKASPKAPATPLPKVSARRR